MFIEERVGIYIMATMYIFQEREKMNIGEKQLT
jgi:hypothetical protein